MEKITVTINGCPVRGSEGMTILDVAQENGIDIPTLCHHPSLTPVGTCQVCLVEDERNHTLVASCVTPVAPGMVINTRSARVLEARRVMVKLLLAGHPDSCLVCDKGNQCQLRRIASELGIGETKSSRVRRYHPIERNLFIERDYSKCILCGRCVRVCQEVRGVEAIALTYSNGEFIVRPSSGHSLLESGCRFCGTCIEVCPTGALIDRDERGVAWAERKTVIVPCQHSCPIQMDVPGYVRLISQAKFSEALAVVRERTPFASICGLVCFRPCETKCRRGELNQPIAIRGLKRFVAEQAGQSGVKSSRVAPSSGKRVAIVGSGPAGLTAGYYLAKLGGHAVTVFEALSEPGGMMRVGIPEYRLPRQVLDTEIDTIRRVGVDIRTKVKIESLDSLFEDGYNAVFVAIGAHKGVKMGIEGEDGPGVLECVSVLQAVNLGKKVRLGHRVAVIGGGNAAIDVSRTALRLGAKRVVIVYRRTRVEMPAAEEGIDEALNEGVEIIYLATPTKITRDNSMVRMQCIRMQLGEADATGRRRPEPIPGSEFSMDFDVVITAIGQTPDVPGGFGLRIGRGSTIEVDKETLATNREGVFAAGDCVSGPASVTQAIAQGRKAAISIDKFLGGSGVIDEILAPPEEVVTWLGKENGFAERQRLPMPSLPVEERIHSFAQVELCFTEEMAIKEAKRCLNCDLRLQFKQLVVPLSAAVEGRSSANKRG